MTEITYEEFKNFMMNDWKYLSGQCMDCDSSPDLYKLPVVGHVIAKYDDSIVSYPITSCDSYTDAMIGGHELREEEFVTVIPAMSKMFKICSSIPEGTPEEIMSYKPIGWEFKILGWEYEGMPVPDWDKIYREACLDYVWRNNLAKLK